MSAAPIVIPEGMGSLTIDGVEMNTPAWGILDLITLWGFPALRGENLTIPGAIGRRANPRRADQTTYPLPMLITGTVDMTGAPYADPMDGLITNLDYLWDNVFSPPALPAKTREAELTMPDLSVRIADVQCDFQDIAHWTEDVGGILQLTVLSGRLLGVSS